MTRFATRMIVSALALGALSSAARAQAAAPEPWELKSDTGYAYDKEGKEVAHASDTLDGAIQQAAYETVMAHGVPAQQTISLQPGTYNLRLGVMDRTSQQIGTLDVPLVVPETVAAKN